MQAAWRALSSTEVCVQLASGASTCAGCGHENSTSQCSACRLTWPGEVLGASLDARNPAMAAVVGYSKVTVAGSSTPNLALTAFLSSTAPAWQGPLSAIYAQEQFDVAAGQPSQDRTRCSRSACRVQGASAARDEQEGARVRTNGVEASLHERLIICHPAAQNRGHHVCQLLHPRHAVQNCLYTQS